MIIDFFFKHYLFIQYNNILSIINQLTENAHKLKIENVQSGIL